MALTDIKVRAAKPTDKQYKLTDGGGMHLLARAWRLYGKVIISNYRYSI
ncbi:DUF4102 domain-containing protein [Escherichia coli]|nr:DUF4102 domain-containing protein [Escherichia coli]EES3539906.1 DUF4102 domain-containing protein [Escherichia coli]EET2842951.1 DUF4102 domain-containing protein [Escherichia coli]EET3444931.1 DUF4102 domain-containing protein [Escherichia coli]EFC6202604.1 DUF4102 domain-containing protein [Escherichia coli]